MNAREHYQAGEQLLAGPPKTAEDRERGIEGDDNWAPSRMDLLQAQTHFLAALTAVVAVDRFPQSVTWREVYGL